MLGFHGKLPAYGDFVWRRLPKLFRDKWDLWLRAGLRESREALGEQWLECYLGAPMWRFALAPTVIDHQSWIGVLMPSVDRGGRYYPLTVAMPCARNYLPVDNVLMTANWFPLVEEVMLHALNDDALDIDSFADTLAQLMPDEPSESSRQLFVDSEIGSQQSVCTRVANTDEFGRALAHLLNQVVSDRLGLRGFWWTTGGEHIEPTIAVFPDLPPATNFDAFLTGRLV